MIACSPVNNSTLTHTQLFMCVCGVITFLSKNVDKENLVNFNYSRFCPFKERKNCNLYFWSTRLMTQFKTTNVFLLEFFCKDKIKLNSNTDRVTRLQQTNKYEKIASLIDRNKYKIIRNFSSLISPHLISFYPPQQNIT
jgi:hypothetical protein